MKYVTSSPIEIMTEVSDWFLPLITDHLLIYPPQSLVQTFQGIRRWHVNAEQSPSLLWFFSPAESPKGIRGSAAHCRGSGARNIEIMRISRSVE